VCISAPLQRFFQKQVTWSTITSCVHFCSFMTTFSQEVTLIQTITSLCAFLLLLPTFFHYPAPLLQTGLTCGWYNLISPYNDRKFFIQTNFKIEWDPVWALCWCCMKNQNWQWCGKKEVTLPNHLTLRDVLTLRLANRTWFSVLNPKIEIRTRWWFKQLESSSTSQSKYCKIWNEH